MKRLGRGSSEKFVVGHAVRLQDVRSGQWSLKGTLAEVVEHDGSPSKTYEIDGEDGGRYLRNGQFVKLWISKARKRKVVSFVEGA